MLVYGRRIGPFFTEAAARYKLNAADDQPKNQKDELKDITGGWFHIMQSSVNTNTLLRYFKIDTILKLTMTVYRKQNKIYFRLNDDLI